MNQVKEIPSAEMPERAVPVAGKGENVVVIGGVPIEIKATKLRYLRNGTANFYRLVERMSLGDIVMLPAGAFGDGDDRDGDKALMDWLIAATDNEAFVTQHYDEFDTDQIYRIVDIFKRVNKFISQEENLKNAQTPREE